MLLIAYLAFFILAMLLAPVLPLFAQRRDGPVNNANNRAVEPRLPRWLFWFDTSTDNSLWGDAGWRTKHCPKYWNSYRGMVLWLWRNPACGFAWSVIARNVDSTETFTVKSSGCGLDLDKGRHQQGWFKIKSDRGAFQYRWVKECCGRQLSFEAGWLLDVYVKDKQAIHCQPKASFMFQPGIRTPRGAG
jgi:hypothetical protein